MSHPDTRPPAADGERALPEEIVKAIRFLIETCLFANRFNDAALINRKTRDAVEALTTSILSRLTAAEAGREELKSQARTQAMKQLASDAGWELENDKLRAERDAALARVERLEKALEGLEADVAAIRFQVAEKAAFGVAPATFGDDAPYSIGWRHACDAIAAEVRSALTEAGRHALKDA